MKRAITVMVSLFVLAMINPLNADTLSAAHHKNTTVIDIAVKRPSVQQITDIVYAQPSVYGYPNKALIMDIMKPQAKEPLPAVLYVPGGAYISSDRNKYFQTKVDIAEAGYVVASIEYRVAPGVLYPDSLKDVKSALRFLRVNAKRFNIDPNRIAIMGNSAGGHLAALAGTTIDMKEFNEGDNLEYSTKVNAVIDLYGPSDLTKIGEGLANQDILTDSHYSESAPAGLWINGMATNVKTTGGIKTNPERAAKANPINYISKDTPPFLVMVGNKDIRVSANQSELLHDALIQKGIDSTFYILNGAGHGGSQWDQKEFSDIVIGFLNKHTKSNVTKPVATSKNYVEQ